MRDSALGASRAPGTPTDPLNHQDEQCLQEDIPHQSSSPPSLTPAVGLVGSDISRSDSYSLSRGGKLVSSQPWSSQNHRNHHQVIVNMQLVDIQKGVQRSSSDGSCRNSKASPEESSSSDTSDSDDTSEDEYEVRTPLRPIDHSPFTLTEINEEEKEEEHEEEKGEEPEREGEESLDDIDGVDAGVNNDEDYVNSESDDDYDEEEENDSLYGKSEPRLQADGHSRTHLVDEDNVNCSLECETDSDSEDDSEGSDSEETESTVRARQVGVGGNASETDGKGMVMNGVDEDHNDTLSTLSGDLSFDDRDVISPPKESGQGTSPVSYVASNSEITLHEGTETSVSLCGEDHDPSTPPNSPSSMTKSIPTPTRIGGRYTQPPLPSTSSEEPKSSMVREKDIPLPAKRAPPEGEGKVIGQSQREGVRAGVFCISGYPRNSHRLDRPHPSHHMASNDLSSTGEIVEKSTNKDHLAIEYHKEDGNEVKNISGKHREIMDKSKDSHKESHPNRAGLDGSDKPTDGSGSFSWEGRGETGEYMALSGTSNPQVHPHSSIANQDKQQELAPRKGKHRTPPPPPLPPHSTSPRTSSENNSTKTSYNHKDPRRENGTRHKNSPEYDDMSERRGSYGIIKRNGIDSDIPSQNPDNPKVVYEVIRNNRISPRRSSHDGTSSNRNEAENIYQNINASENRRSSYGNCNGSARDTNVGNGYDEIKNKDRRHDYVSVNIGAISNPNYDTGEGYYSLPQLSTSNCIDGSSFASSTVCTQQSSQQQQKMQLPSRHSTYRSQHQQCPKISHPMHRQGQDKLNSLTHNHLQEQHCRPEPKPRLCHQQQQQRQPNQHQQQQINKSQQLRQVYDSEVNNNSSSSIHSNTSNSSRDRLSGSSGLRSPAHTVTGATPTPLMPRLLTTPGLTGSTSRLSGGSEGGGVPNYSGLSSTRLGGSYTALASSAASSGYGSCPGGAAGVASRHEDSEDLSDVSSGATSEDSARRRRRRSAQPMKGEASVSGNEDFEWVRASPMLTGLLEGHVTRLATPPDHRGHTLRTSLATPPESGEEGTGGLSSHRHRQYPRPPPVPRPRTLEAGDLIPHRPVRDPRDGLRDRLYSPARDLTSHRKSRDSSIERSVRDSSCERGSLSSLHQHNHQHHHHLSSRLPQHTCECPTCWGEEEEGGYDSCDERNHHHRHSYHEGLHHAHLHQLQSHHHGQSGGREASRERRNRGQGSGDSGRSSPCCCRHCHHLGSMSSLSSHDYCANNRLALPCTNKGSSLEDRVNRLEGDKDSLQLQVTVLSEQVEAQTEKIQDMEALLEQKKELLRKTEEQLQKEIMARSSLETQRLELFSEISNMKLRQAAYERENVDLRDKIRRSDHHMDHTKAQSLVASVGRSSSGRSITPAAASTPVHSVLRSPDSPPPKNFKLPPQMANSPSPSTISTLSTIPSSSPQIPPPVTVSPTSSPMTIASHDARDYLPPRTPPPNARRKIDQFGTIPRQRESELGGASTTGRTKGVMFGKGLHFLPFRVAGKRSTSAPNLAETEMQMIDDIPEGDYGSPVDGIPPPASSPRMNTLAGHRSPTTQHKTTGIKKIFTKLRRSSSGHLESDLGDGDFRRGGMRATASARLGWTSPNTAFKEPNEAFRNWNMEIVEAWLGGLGLSQYCPAVRSWTGNGHHLSQATPQQLDRDLGIRHPLHRKKLQLAISARVTGDQLNTPLARLDHTWVLRWLDDVGLPQYKDAFSEARIDGRVLNFLTYDDLAFLRFTNLLHVTSLKRGIQVLREHNFDPSVLKRRSVPDEEHSRRSSSEVALWTNHRVMEWLRTVDLSEYAPNLRGSGVHGALMVYEVRFTSELLASLLSIPCGKTLLRRHLNTHFKELVGLSVVQEKRELEATTGYTPLTTSAKVKMPKKSQFSLKRKKSKSELDFDDLLCPLDEKPPSGAIQDKEKEINGDGRLC